MKRCSPGGSGSLSSSPTVPVSDCRYERRGRSFPRGRYAWNDRGRHINGNNVHKATAFRHKTHLAADPQEPPVNFRRIAMMADSVAADGVEPVNGYRQPRFPALRTMASITIC